MGNKILVKEFLKQFSKTKKKLLKKTKFTW